MDWRSLWKEGTQSHGMSESDCGVCREKVIPQGGLPLWCIYSPAVPASGRRASQEGEGHSAELSDRRSQER